MKTRLELQETLEELLGSRNVYYEPPANIKMEYPAIVYSRDNIQTRFASNKVYIGRPMYRLTVIDKKADNPVITKLLNLEYCSYDRHYKSDNLNHDTFTIYL